MKKNLLILALSSLSTGAFAQSSIPQSNSDIEVKAVVDAGCDLTADNISFGILMMPISDTNANSNMNIKCSKGANLEIAVTYSSISTGGLNTTTKYTYEHQPNTFSFNIYNIYKDNKMLGQIHCSNNYTHMYGTEIIQEFNYTKYGVTEMCSGNNIVPSSILSEKSAVVNMGSITGMTSNEKISYYLEKPNTTSVWNTENKYQLIATGEEQPIAMNAKIKRADNATHRMTPDSYQGTLSIILNY